MSLEFIYQKEANLDNENNFTIAISEKNSIEKEEFISGEKYLLPSLERRLKDKDITKWPDYEKINILSEMIDATKKKNHLILI